MIHRFRVQTSRASLTWTSMFDCHCPRRPGRNGQVELHAGESVSEGRADLESALEASRGPAATDDGVEASASFPVQFPVAGMEESLVSVPP